MPRIPSDQMPEGWRVVGNAERYVAPIHGKAWVDSWTVGHSSHGYEAEHPEHGTYVFGSLEAAVTYVNIEVSNGHI